MRAAAAVLLALVMVAPRIASGQSDTPATAPATPSSGAPTGTDVPGATMTPGEQSPEGRLQTEKLARIHTVSLAGAVDPQTYRLGPGDVLVLQLWGAVSRTIPLEIGPEGTVLLPGAGSMRVDGWTLAQARETLLARMRPQFRHVNMDLRLAEPRTFRVYLTGRVRAPGPVDAMGSSRVADLVTPAVLGADASRRHITLLHRDGTREMVDLDLFLKTGNDALNPWLRDGDVIQVPAAVDFVWVEGAVADPGRYELGPRDSLVTLLKLAGDPLPSAEAGRAMLIRFVSATRAESLWFSLPEVYTGKSNVPLEEGERLYVYFIPRYHEQQEATVTGEVVRPGTFPIIEGRTRLSYLVGAAEGFLPTADLSAIRVHRRNPAAGEHDPELDRLLRLSRNELTASEYEKLRTRLAELREDYRIDWNRLQREKDLDLLLRDGDIVRIEPLVSSIRIDGEVARPGILAYAHGLNVGDYVREAGGFTERAWRGKVRVTRAVTGQTLLARNVPRLDPGDFVWVPEKPDVTAWQQVREVLTAVASIATVVIAIRSVR